MVYCGSDPHTWARTAFTSDRELEGLSFLRLENAAFLHDDRSPLTNAP